MFQIVVGSLPIKEVWTYQEAIKYLQELNPDCELIWGASDLDSEDWIYLDSKGKTSNIATIRTV